MFRNRNNMNCARKRAQTMLEYLALLSIVVAVLLAMGVYIQRGIQGMIKITADQLGNQQDADQDITDDGYLVNAVSISRSQMDKTTRERIGTVNYIYSDELETESRTITNLGFTERP